MMSATSSASCYSDECPSGELIAAPSYDANRERPSVERVALIIETIRSARARSVEIPLATRRLVRAAVLALGPRGWWRLWRRLAAHRAGHRARTRW
jgi:hypothetical protein